MKREWSIIALGALCAACTPQQERTVSFRFEDPKPGGKIIDGEPADPKDWPATKVFTSTTGSCTATVVGSQAVLTAAHCVDAGSTGEIVIGGKTVEITCTHHPKFSSDDNFDVALCKAAALLGTSFLYERVSTTELALNTKVKILGFGCTTNNGTEFGALTIGDATVTRLPTKTDPRYQLTQGAYGCQGDSGGAGYTGADKGRLVFAVMESVTPPQKLSSQVSTGHADIKLFLTDWSSKNKVGICGIATAEKNCRA